MILLTIIVILVDNAGNLSTGFPVGLEMVSVTCTSTQVPQFTSTDNGNGNFAFNGTANPPPSPNVTAWCWDFGDATAGSGPNVSHTYGYPGVSKVCLTIIDDCGCTASTCLDIHHGGDSPCPCTDINALNIDAGESPTDPNKSISGVSVILTPLAGGQSAKKSYDNTGRCIAVRGHLMIDNNFDLTIYNGEIRMQPGAKIIVKKGAKLTIKGVQEGGGIHGCEKMWRSIAVEPGGALILVGNTIQDGEYAIDISGDNDISSFAASSNTFDRNHVSIRVNGTITQPTVFQKNIFSATSPLLSVYSSGISNWSLLRPYTGLDLNATMFNIGKPDNAASENIFTGLRNGVIAVGGDVRLYYAKFTKMYYSLGYEDLPNFNDLQGQGIFGRSALLTVHHCIFGGEGNNGWRAISTVRTNLDAKYNDIYDLVSGILSVPAGASSIVIEENDFRVTLPDFAIGQGAYIINGAAQSALIQIKNNNPIQIRGAGPGILLKNNLSPQGTESRRVSGNHISHTRPFYQGIKVENSSNWILDDNHILYSGFPTENNFTQRTRGIELTNADNCLLRDNEVLATDGSLIGTNMRGIELTGSENCTLCCNITDGTQIGNFFMGACGNTKLRHAQLNDHFTGLLCSDIGTVIGDQEWAGNQWLGDYENIGALHWGSDANIEGSEFFIEGPETTDFWPPSRWPDDDDVWFRKFSGNSQPCGPSDANCPNLPPFSAGGPRDLTNDERQIASDTYLSAHLYDRTTQRESERSLYRQMSGNASLLGQDATADQFFADASIGFIGQLEHVEQQIAHLGFPSVNHQNRSLWLEHQLDSLAQARHQIDHLYVGAQNEADSTAVSNQKRTYVLAARPLLTEWLWLHDTLQSGMVTRVPGIIAQNNSIASNSTWVSNRKAVNRIYLETLAQGIYTATPQQMSDLLIVASQCMLAGGDAVLQARSLYNSFAETPLVIDDSDICDQGNQNRERSAKSSVAHISHPATLIPNPTRDAFSLIVKGIVIGEMLRVEVVNSNGIVESDLNLPNGSAISAAFKPGLYICRIYIAEELAGVVKLVVIP